MKNLEVFITNKDLNEIKLLLSNWRQERHLKSEQQVVGIIPNLIEEVLEFIRANSEYEKIDALCDIIVFALNTEKVFNFNFDRYNAEIKTLEGNISGILFYLSHLYNLYDAELFRYYLTRILKLALEAIDYMGYDPYECLKETIKEISSRTGSWNEGINKFVKHPGAYTYDEAYSAAIDVYNIQIPILEESNNKWIIHTSSDDKSDKFISKWYKADYSKCKY